MEKQIVIDWSGVHSQDFKTLIISIPIFSIYSLLLVLLCSIEDYIIAGLLFLVMQLVFGMSLTRVYHVLGNRAKSELKLIDPSKMIEGWTTLDKEIHVGKLSQVFERFLSSILEADKKSTDDVNDIAWFLIAVWAMGSTLVTLTWESHFLICLATAAFLVLVCFVTYYEGHKGLVNGYFEDEIDHLEYHIQTRLDSTTTLHPSGKSFISWKTKNGKMVLNDFYVSFQMADSKIKYHLGIPSSDAERIEIQANPQKITRLEKELGESSSTHTVWRFHKINESTAMIMNDRDVLDISLQGSFVRDPETPAYLTNMIVFLLGILGS